MPEVLTQVDKDDSLEKFKQEQSDKERWNAGCANYGVVPFTIAWQDALKEGNDVSSAMRVAARNLERTRLEREVIDAAKAARGASI